MRRPSCIPWRYRDHGEEFNRPYGTDTNGAIMAKVSCPYGTGPPSHEHSSATQEQRLRPLLASVSRPTCPHSEMHPSAYGKDDNTIRNHAPAWDTCGILWDTRGIRSPIPRRRRAKRGRQPGGFPGSLPLSVSPLAGRRPATLMWIG